MLQVNCNFFCNITEIQSQVEKQIIFFKMVVNSTNLREPSMEELESPLIPVCLLQEETYNRIYLVDRKNLKYCRYGVKHNSINQSIDQTCHSGFRTMKTHPCAKAVRGYIWNVQFVTSLVVACIWVIVM